MRSRTSADSRAAGAAGGGAGVLPPTAGRPRSGGPRAGAGERPAPHPHLRQAILTDRSRAMPAPRSLTLAATAFAALAGCRAASGPKLMLRYHPRAGAAYHYALEQHNTMRFEGGPMGAMPEHSVTMRMYYTQLVGSVAARSE